MNYAVLVDSGSDRCIFDAEVARELGIDVEKTGKVPTPSPTTQEKDLQRSYGQGTVPAHGRPDGPGSCPGPPRKAGRKIEKSMPFTRPSQLKSQPAFVGSL